jgi:hypothetical protein
MAAERSPLQVEDCSRRYNGARFCQPRSSDLDLLFQTYPRHHRLTFTTEADIRAFQAVRLTEPHEQSCDLIEISFIGPKLPLCHIPHLRPKALVVLCKGSTGFRPSPNIESVSILRGERNAGKRSAGEFARFCEWISGLTELDSAWTLWPSDARSSPISLGVYLRTIVGAE